MRQSSIPKYSKRHLWKFKMEKWVNWTWTRWHLQSVFKSRLPEKWVNWTWTRWHLQSVFKSRLPPRTSMRKVTTLQILLEGFWKKETRKNGFGRNERFYRHKISFADVEHFGKFFQQRGLRINDYRQSLTPMNLEMQLFLKFNKNFWDIGLVSRMCSEWNNCNHWLL